MKRRLTILVLLILCRSLSSRAEVIQVSGVVSGFWRADTVLVVGEVQIQAGSSLTIDPGVRVLFNGHYKLIVNSNSTLTAAGTVGDSIYFSAVIPDSGWYGIRFLSSSSSSRLAYCHLTHGRAYGSGEDALGGAILCNSSNPTIEHCLIDSNTASWGGAIHLNNSSPTISSNSIIGNSVTGSYSYGGAISCIGISHPAISGNVITGNSAQYGGAISCYSGTSPVISSNTISQNYAAAEGGGIFCYMNSTPVINLNTISGNSAWNGAGIWCYYSSAEIAGNTIGSNTTHTSYGDGGGICLWYSSAEVDNNDILGNIADDKGGGIFLYASNATISNNFIDSNIASSSGGGLYCYFYSTPLINNNIISNNSAGGAYGKGGGIYCSSIFPMIMGNSILNNAATSSGGGIYCMTDPDIISNTISGNSAIHGGGIFCYNSNARISGNLINENFANITGGNGGGIYMTGLYPEIESNQIIENTAQYGGGIYDYASYGTIKNNALSLNTAGFGGGIYCYNANGGLSDNSLYQNSASYFGGIYCAGTINPPIVNCVLWNNTIGQIYMSIFNSPVTYCNIMGGWPGTGNISGDPNFVDVLHQDLRLQWGSPCIDAGNPASTYNDPDSTRSDIGAGYFNQTLPVNVFLTPHVPVLVIPATGGSFDYTLRVANADTIQHTITIWCNIAFPNGTIHGPVMQPVTIQPQPGVIRTSERTQLVPGQIPGGIYTHNAFAIVGSDTSRDSFTFSKVGADGATNVAGWFNFGQEFTDNAEVPDDRIFAAVEAQPLDFTVFPCFPNPFNSTTIIRYVLPEASQVQLVVYDCQGRLVSKLMEENREAGFHEAMLDGSKLPSGIYLYRLHAGEHSGSGKVVLIK
ncbi:MAG: right-handed parallel beta-helix repeat-containing protein [bacterium]